MVKRIGKGYCGISLLPEVQLARHVNFSNLNAPFIKFVIHRSNAAYSIYLHPTTIDRNVLSKPCCPVVKTRPSTVVTPRLYPIYPTILIPYVIYPSDPKCRKLWIYNSDKKGQASLAYCWAFLLLLLSIEDIRPKALRH